MDIEKAAAEISNLPRDEEENQDADRHQRNSCAPGNANVFSSTTPHNQQPQYIFVRPLRLTFQKGNYLLVLLSTRDQQVSTS